MSIVVDASVAAKWFVPEVDSDRAENLRLTGEPLIAPTVIVAEIGNVFWKHALRGVMTPARAVEAIQTAIGILSPLVALEELFARATELAIDLRHPIYDCFYLALAERERAPLVSADAKFLAAAARVKGVKARKL